MRLSKVERSILDHLTTKGAATRLELSAATGFSKSGIRNAIRTLVAGNHVKQHVLKREDGYSHRHRTFVAAVEAPAPTPAPEPKVSSVNVFEHPEIYNRLRELEEQYTRLDKTVSNIREDLSDSVSGLQNELAALNKSGVDVSGIKDAIKIVAKRVKELDLDRIRIDGVLIEQGDRIRALEPQPAVDPLYAEIERDITETLGGKYSHELLRALIESAYAERSK